MNDLEERIKTMLRDCYEVNPQYVPQMVRDIITEFECWAGEKGIDLDSR